MSASPSKSVDLASRLWDKLPDCLEKLRYSKHTAKALASFYHDLAHAEESYAKATQKAIAALPAEVLRREGKTLQAACAALATEQSHRAKCALRVKTAYEETAKALTAQRQYLSDTRSRLDKEVEEAAKQLRTASEAHARAIKRQEKLSSELARKPQPGADTLLENAGRQVVETQTQQFLAQNALHRCVARTLTAVERTELQRLADLKARIQSAQQAGVDAHCEASAPFAATASALEELNGVGDTEEFAKGTESGKPSPWQPPQQRKPTAEHDTTERPPQLQPPHPQQQQELERKGGASSLAAAPPWVPLRDLLASLPSSSASSSLLPPFIPPGTPSPPCHTLSFFPASLPPGKQWQLSAVERSHLAYEALLLATRFTHGYELEGARRLVEETFRISLGIAKRDSLRILTGLRLPLPLSGSSAALPSSAELSSIGYRLDMLRRASPEAFGGDAPYYRAWARRHAASILSALLFAMEQRQSPQEQQKQVLTLFDRCLRLIDVFSTAPDFGEVGVVAKREIDAMLDRIEALVKETADVDADGAAGAGAAEAEHKEAIYPFPARMLRRLYDPLLRCCLAGVGSAAEEDDDEEDEEPRLAPKWKEVLDALEPVRSLWGISTRWHNAALLRCLFTLLEAQRRADGAESLLDTDGMAGSGAEGDITGLIDRLVGQVTQQPSSAGAERNADEREEAWLLGCVVNALTSALCDALPFDARAVALSFRWHRSLLSWLAPPSPDAAAAAWAEAMLRCSADAAFQACLPSTQASSSSHPPPPAAPASAAAAASGSASAKQAPLPMEEWKGEDWAKFGSRLMETVESCVAVAEEIAGMEAPLETAITQFCESWRECLESFLQRRAEAGPGSGSDGIAPAIVAPAVTVLDRIAQLDTDFREERRGQVWRLVPPLASLASQHFSRWREKQGTHLEAFCERCVGEESWTPLPNAKHSSSAGDFLTILHTVTDGFFLVARGLVPFSAQQLPSLLSLLNASLSSYGAQVVASAGSPSDVRPAPPTQYVKKQQEEKGFMSRLFNRNARNTVSEAKSPAPPTGRKASDASPSSSPTPSLCSLRIEGIATRIACLHSVKESLAGLAESLRAQWTNLGLDAVSQRHTWYPRALPSPPAAPSFEPGRLFASAFTALQQAQEQLCERLAVLIIWQRLDPHLSALYSPCPTLDGTPNGRLRDSTLLLDLDVCMREVFSLVPEAAFPACCTAVLRELCLGVSHVLLYGYRDVSRAHTGLLLDDVKAIEELFQAEVALPLIETTSRRLRDVIRLFELSADALVTLFHSKHRSVTVSDTALAFIILHPHRKKTEPAAKKFSQWYKANVQNRSN